MTAMPRVTALPDRGLPGGRRTTACGLRPVRNLGEKIAGSVRDRIQPFDLQLAAYSKRVHERRRQSRKVNRQLSPVWAPSVIVGKPIEAAAFPGADQLARSRESVGIAGQGRDGAPDEQRRLRLEEIAVLLAGVAPIRLCHSESLQHRLRAKESWRDGNCCDSIRLQFARHIEREAL